MKASIIYGKNIKFDHVINDLKIDSRKITENDCFYALDGAKTSGVNFIKNAIDNGAKTIVLEDDNVEIVDGINYVFVENVKLKIAEDLFKLYKYIFKKVKVYSCTSTNGKTTVTTLIYRYLRSCGINASLVGSNGNFVLDTYYPSNNTTDDICTLYELLKESYNKGVKYFIIEASSHAIKELRIKHLPIEVAMFLNLSLDHLDYHKTMEDYMYTKLIHLKEAKKTIINKDDHCFSIYSKYLNNFKTIGRSNADYTIIKEDVNIKGCKFNIKMKNQFSENYYFITNLLGDFNVDNITMFIAFLCEINLFDYGKIYNFLKTTVSIPGRMELYQDKGISYLIDFAHTPDGVKKVLKFLNKIKLNRIITVVGCGGSRDKLKREQVGKIASQYSDWVIFTSDNPRDEDEEEIIKQIIKGANTNNYSHITSRKEAIKESLKLAVLNDVVAILGKGNETFIEKKNIKIPYNDKEYLLSLLGEK